MNQQNNELVIVTVHDVKSRSYGTPVVADSVAHAARNFELMVADEKNRLMHDYPQDFELLHLANYNEFSGVITPLSAPVVVATGNGGVN